MLIFVLVPCYLGDKLLILPKHYQKINGKQLLINNFNQYIPRSEQHFLRALIGQLGGDQPSIIHLRAPEVKQNGFCRYIVTNKVTLWAASYSACVIYTKTIIHLSVGVSGGYLPLLRGIIVNYISTRLPSSTEKAR